MKNLSKVALGALILAMLVGCGEDAKFGDKEYTFEYLRDNEQLLVEMVFWCEANKNAKLSTIQMKNCETADLRKRRLIQIYGWEKLVEKYGSKDKK
ncbi:hypothetical protein [Campylobacter hyointestinalis]|uniref:hypothetical protein n=1 Tax=Campylobacter hyointestinalis TaxID=198 RepID=UPI000DCC8EB5|nr:hypothetical protein [Campylobacter hyointestinalis]RAZ45737.1 hypothetical protein CHL14416_07405 [Campylobacter hyointestinalis subsp. lawsonii]